MIIVFLCKICTPSVIFYVKFKLIVCANALNTSISNRGGGV